MGGARCRRSGRSPPHGRCDSCAPRGVRRRDVLIALMLFGCNRTVPYTPAPEVRTQSGGVNIYAADRAGALAPLAARSLPRVYGPYWKSASVTIIDPQSYRALRTFPTCKIPQHVVPSYD